jgi:class 3 adenylate cyclase
MNRLQRKRLLENLVLGVLLTTLVVAAERGGMLVSMERWLSDRRARWCQFFEPPTPDQIVHVDIDDNTIKAVGEDWPWPRAVVGKLIEEIHRGGPSFIALDIVFSERTDRRPFGSSTLPGSASASGVDDDRELADSCRRCGNVLIPVALSLTSDEAPPSPLRQQLASLLDQNLALTSVQAQAELERLEWDWNSRGPFGRRRDIFEAEFAAAQRQAIAQRVARELKREWRSREQIASAVCPATAPSPVRQAINAQIDDAYFDAAGRRALARFAAPPYMGAARPSPEFQPQPLLAARDDLAALPELLDAACASGFVNYLPFDDGVVRSLPLFVLYEGRPLPQMGLSIACAALNVRPQDAQIQSDGVMLRRDKQDVLFIPTHIVRSDRFGRVGTFVDVPLRGTSDWLTMYDPPRHAEARQHVPMTMIWDLLVARESMIANDRQARRAMELVYNVKGSRLPPNFRVYFDDLDEMKRACDRVDEELRNQRISREYGKSVAIPAAERKADEQGFVHACDDLRAIAHAGRLFVEQARRVRDHLSGKSVIVASIATASGDMVPTALHAKCPGAVLHGALANAILQQRIPRHLPRWLNDVMTLALGLACMVAVIYCSPLRAALLSAALALGYLLFNGVWLFAHENRILGAAGPLAAALLTTAALVTICYVDLAGFTSMSRSLGEKSVLVINRFLETMVPLIREKGGYVNKFLGDGILFFFGAPVEQERHADAAVKTILAMQRAMPALNRRLAEEKLPAISMRAGISSGKVVVGDAGFAEASDYTVIGDAANLGSRLEALNKQFGTCALLSGRTSELLAARFLLRRIGRVQVVGSDRPEEIYEPLALCGVATRAQLRLADLSEAVVDAFQRRDVQACLRAIDVMEESSFAGTFTCFYRARCAADSAGPAVPEDGTLIFSNK